MNFIDIIKQQCNIYCICLQERSDRYNSACKEFESVGLGDSVYFHRPKLCEKGGAYGLFESVYWCLNHSLMNNPNKMILIFEDDIGFNVDQFKTIQFPEFFHNSNNFNEWDTIRLGYWKGIFIEHLINTDFYRGSCHATHAVIWSPLFAKKCLEDKTPFEKRDIFDWYIIKVSGRHYLIKNSSCNQKSGLGTNIIWPSVDIQNRFQLNPTEYQLKYQRRTHIAWNLIGRFIPYNNISGILQMLVVIDFGDILNKIWRCKSFYVFKNICLLN